MMSMIANTLKPLASGDQLLEHVLPYFWTREPSGRAAPFSLSNHMIMMGIAALLVFLVFSYVGSRARKHMVPSGVHNFFESILSFLRTELIRPALGENADRFTPFIWTVFFFVLFCNLLGLIPVNEIVGLTLHRRVHIWGTATANFSVTGGLALLAIIVVHLSGITQAIRIKMDPSLAPHHQGSDHAQPHGHGEMHGMEGIEDERDVVLDHRVGDGHDHAHGVHRSRQFQGQPFPMAVATGIGTYIWNFAPHPDMGSKIMDVFMWFVLLILEWIGALVKPFSLCVRLFANMVAGHLVIAAMVGLVPFAAAVWLWGSVSVIVVAGCTALDLLELFVAFLQAYIFTFLTTLFIASAIAPEH
jgi:F0F1-type ATP synthase membrane subunit a